MSLMLQSRIEDIRNKLQNRRNDIKNRVSEFRDKIKSRIEERRQGRAGQGLLQILNGGLLDRRLGLNAQRTVFGGSGTETAQIGVTEFTPAEQTSLIGVQR